MRTLSFKIRISLNQDESCSNTIKDLAYKRLLAIPIDENHSLMEERLHRELKIVEKRCFF